MAPDGDNNLSSPWSHVVRGSEPEAMTAGTTPSPSSSSSTTTSPAIPSLKSSALEAAKADNSDIGSSSSNETRGKKPAWRKPSNIAVEVGHVSGAALSESARASPGSSSDSLKALSEGSVYVSQPTPNRRDKGSIMIASSPQKPTPANPNSNPNHAFLAGQKSTKRGGGPTNSGETSPLPPPPVDAPQRASAVVPESSPRDLPLENNNWETGPKEPVVPHFHNGNSHPRNSFRRGYGGGPHPRSGSGDGPYHNNYTNRRDHHRPNYEWNSHRSFSGRDGHMHHQRFMPRNFYRPPSSPSPPFVNPSPIRPYANPMGYPNTTYPYYLYPAPHPESFGGGQYIANAVPPVMYYPQQDPQLLFMLVKQIDYYFSPGNLCKDIFLRQNMDEYGWVPITVIADFNRVKQLTRDVPSILAAVQTSTVVEVQGDKIRKRNDWIKWLLPPPDRFPAVLNPWSSGTSSVDLLAAHMQSFGLEGSSSDNNMRGTLAEPNISSRSSSVESNKSILPG